LNFGLHSGILALDVRDQTNTQVLEGSFLLEFVPLLLENIHSFLHFELHEEVTNEIIYDDITVYAYRFLGLAPHR
jgi:hypothetical protein